MGGCARDALASPGVLWKGERGGLAFGGRRVVCTTYGFARVAGQVRLSVIHYVRPMQAFTAHILFPPLPRPIELAGWSFPVVVRPWLHHEHGGALRLDSNCWVKFRDGHDYSPGVLTARHAVRRTPKRSRTVVVNVSRRVPSGYLRRESVTMDAALIAVGSAVWGKRVEFPHSRVVGYKPVRLVTDQGQVDADVVEHSGFNGGAFLGAPGQDPLNGAFMFINRSAEARRLRVSCPRHGV